MRKLVNLLGPALVYGCVATVLAQVIFFTYMPTSGMLTKERMFQLAAVAYGVDLAAMEAEYAMEHQETETENVAYEQIVQARAVKSRNLELSEQALRSGLDSLRNIQSELATKKDRYDRLFTTFEAKLEKLQNVAKDRAILELQQTFETLKTKQAKDQILRILPRDFRERRDEALTLEEKEAVIAVVTIMKSMSLDKRKKIFTEFKGEDEPEKLAEILRYIRIGVPEVTLIQSTFEQLQGFKPSNT